MTTSTSPSNIPAHAVEAAMCAWLERSKATGSWSLEEEVRAALEAAAPHMLAGALASIEALCEEATNRGIESGPPLTLSAIRDALSPTHE